MEQEVEIQVSLNQPQAAISKLNKKVEASEEIRQKDSYFVPPDRDFFNKQPTREYLRVRQTKNKD